MEKHYNIIYADPPWEYAGSLQKNSAASDHYPTMKTEAIASMRVLDWAAPDCALFIWGTWPKYKDTMTVLEAWGFEYRTVGFVWLKTNKSKATKQYSFLPEDSFAEFFGLGKWTRSNTEFCLIGTRGAIRPVKNDVRQVVYAPIGEHSQKPNEVRERIVELMGDLPRLEMFARRAVAGWDVFGNEIDNSIRLAV